MATLHILSLTCVDQEDTNATDEVILQIDGDPAFGPHSMSTGGVVNFVNFTREFTDKVVVGIVEDDGSGVPDFIGDIAISETAHPPFADATGYFHSARPHADYHMVFHIHP